MTLPYKGQTSKYDYHFSNFGRSPIPNNLCKDSASWHPGYCRRRFLMFCAIYWHDGHLGQSAATLVPFQKFFIPLTYGGPIWNFERIWLSGFRGEVVWNSQQLSHTNVWGIQMQKEANMTLTWKGQMSKYDNHFSSFSRSPVPDDLCKYLAPRHPRFWSRRFF